MSSLTGVIRSDETWSNLALVVTVNEKLETVEFIFLMNQLQPQMKWQ